MSLRTHTLFRQGCTSCFGDIPKPLLKRHPLLTEEGMGHYNSFVVRVWTDGKEPGIRGQIEHVGTREKVYFADETHMHQFIISHLDPPSSEVNEFDKLSSDQNNAG